MNPTWMSALCHTLLRSLVLGLCEGVAIGLLAVHDLLAIERGFFRLALAHRLA